jgi:hypothetical protein
VNTNGTARPGPGIPTRLPILMYHEIGDRSQTSSPLAVTPGAAIAGNGHLTPTMVKDHALTRGYAVVRRARTLLNREAPLCNAPASPW